MCTKQVDVNRDIVTVAAIDPNGPCHGIVRRGDVMLKIDGLPMLSASQVKKQIMNGPPGSEFEMQVSQASVCRLASYN